MFPPSFELPIALHLSVLSRQIRVSYHRGVFFPKWRELQWENGWAVTELDQSARTSEGPVHRDRQPEDLALLDALRQGSEPAFLELVARYQSAMLRLANTLVRNRAIAEEVVQETWLAVLKGIGTFESRSSLKTWIFRILANRARTRAEREGRTVAFSSLVRTEIDASDPAVPPERFLSDAEDLPGHWGSPPVSWGESPEKQLLSQEILNVIRTAIEALPHAQQIVITLRDRGGWTSEEVASVLDISEPYQRVLLHRARSKVRCAVERYFEQNPVPLE